MALVTDQTSDVNFQELYRYAQWYDFPDFVKAASVEDVQAPDSLPSSAYADVANRRFPCHTKTACYLSWVNFLEKKNGLAEKMAGWIEERLAGFADYWKISGDVADLRQKHAEIHRDSEEGLPDSSYAIVWIDDGGSKQRRYPLRGTAEVKTAAEWFERYRDQLLFTDRQAIAVKVLEKAAEYGAALPRGLEDVLERHAGNGVYDPKEAGKMIRERVKAADKVPEAVAQQMLKLAAAVEDNPALAMDRTSTANLAATVDNFDRKYHLAGKYSELIPRVEDVLFKGMLKAASEFVANACQTVSGSVYEKQQFAKLSQADVRAAFGDELAAAVSSGLRVDFEKMAIAASTLPLPDAKILDRLMVEAREFPRSKAAMDPGLSAGQREELARDYLRG